MPTPGITSASLGGIPCPRLHGTPSASGVRPMTHTLPSAPLLTWGPHPEVIETPLAIEALYGTSRSSLKLFERVYKHESARARLVEQREEAVAWARYELDEWRVVALDARQDARAAEAAHQDREVRVAHCFAVEEGALCRVEHWIRVVEQKQQRVDRLAGQVARAVPGVARALEQLCLQYGDDIWAYFLAYLTVRKSYATVEEIEGLVTN